MLATRMSQLTKEKNNIFGQQFDWQLLLLLVVVGSLKPNPGHIKECAAAMPKFKPTLLASLQFTAFSFQLTNLAQRLLLLPLTIVVAVVASWPHEKYRRFTVVVWRCT